MGSRPRARGRVMWDEDNLDYLEANKSPKRKITEPKTPYHAPEDSDGAVSDDGFEPRVHFDPEAVKSALSDVASSSTANGKRWRSGWTSSEDEKDDDHILKDPEQRQRFADLRRAHYDEFRRLKILRSQSSAWQDEDEERAAAAAAAAAEKSHADQEESKLADAVGAIDIEPSTATPMEN